MLLLPIERICQPIESFYDYYQLLPRVGLEKDDVITRQKWEGKRGAAAAYAAGNAKFAKDDL